MPAYVRCQSDVSSPNDINVLTLSFRVKSFLHGNPVDFLPSLFSPGDPFTMSIVIRPLKCILSGGEPGLHDFLVPDNLLMHDSWEVFKFHVDNISTKCNLSTRVTLGAINTKGI